MCIARLWQEAYSYAIVVWEVLTARKPWYRDASGYRLPCVTNRF